MWIESNEGDRWLNQLLPISLHVVEMCKRTIEFLSNRTVHSSIALDIRVGCLKLAAIRKVFFHAYGADVKGSHLDTEKVFWVSSNVQVLLLDLTALCDSYA